MTDDDATADEISGEEPAGAETALDEFGVDEFGVDVGPGSIGGTSRWQAPEPTGVQAVDDAVAPLAELDQLPTAEHVAYYETAHRHLQDALADLDGA